MKRPKLADEVKFFARSAIFAIVVGAIYWILSYEWAGAVLLITFGLAAAFATAILFAGAQARARSEASASESSVGPDMRPDGPFGDESGRLPAPSLAPLVVGLGLAVAVTGLAFGIWFVLAGVIILFPGVLSWIGSIQRELRAVTADDRPTDDAPAAVTPGEATATPEHATSARSADPADA